MQTEEAGRYWNANAEAWTVLARAGGDVYRDYLNTPAFFAELPDVSGLNGLDIGCGEGHNTRLLAQRGAQVHAIDIAETFIQYAQLQEDEHPLGITYQVASATTLPFPDEQFEFATSFMCLMDLPETDAAFREAFRVLKPGGFFQFSISHPCYDTPHRKNLRRLSGKTYAIEVGDYFQKVAGKLTEWTFGSAPAALRNRFPKFRIPMFNRTLSEWFMMMIHAGFVVEWMQEPCPDAETIRQYPEVQDAEVVAYFLHIRCRKPHR